MPVVVPEITSCPGQLRLASPTSAASHTSRVIDSFVCDGPGRPDFNLDGVGDDLNPTGPWWQYPATHSFYNANGFNGRATPGLININTAPVLDMRRKNTSKVIGDRSFSNDSKVVKKIGSLFIEKFHKNKIATVIKHIPGHGLAKLDSHKSTPVVRKNLKYLVKNDFFPFRKQKSLFALTAHIVYESIDPICTATHSKKVIKIIRNNIKFKNIIISDDISMKSLKFSISENTIKAFKAGCNIVLHCNARMSEMIKVAKNSPELDSFLMKKTSEFYKLIS